MTEWFKDVLSADEAHHHRVEKTLVRRQTRFQRALVADLSAFGRCLVLDGEIQSAERDEFIYHEGLVQPAMAAHPAPKDILILGGGEGATVREVLRHPNVRRVTMVDIDGEVVEFCQRHLARWHQGSFKNPKTQLVIGDAREFVQMTGDHFDIIFSDLPTPAGAGPLTELYRPSFYRAMVSRLKPGGLFVAQAGSGSLLQMGFHARLANTLRRFFKIVRPYYAFVPSFDVPWAFLFCSQKIDPQRLDPKKIDRRLGTLRSQLRFYDGQTHRGLFHVPKYLRAALNHAHD